MPARSRLYTLFYRAWQKYRMVSMAAGLVDSPMAQRIAGLAGIGREKLGDPFYARVLAYTGSLAGRVRSKEALRALLSDFLGGLPVALCEWQPRWTEIHNPPRLGVDSRLGTSAMLGTRTWTFRASSACRSARFRAGHSRGSCRDQRTFRRLKSW